LAGLRRYRLLFWLHRKEAEEAEVGQEGRRGGGGRRGEAWLGGVGLPGGRTPNESVSGRAVTCGQVSYSHSFASHYIYIYANAKWGLRIFSWLATRMCTEKIYYILNSNFFWREKMFLFFYISEKLLNKFNNCLNSARTLHL